MRSSPIPQATPVPSSTSSPKPKKKKKAAVKTAQTNNLSKVCAA